MASPDQPHCETKAGIHRTPPGSPENLGSPNAASAFTRRQVLKVLGVGALSAGAGPLSSRCAEAVASQVGGRRSMASPTLQAFPLRDVRLLEGPFLAAQKRDEAYLLKLEPDHMLHSFRVNAGLQPKAPVYGGWESVQTWADIRAHGHTLGHYLA